ncbi:MAG: flavin reductase [Oscillospiraceae bacterium]|nr:flavin reductase [Oscillospiraceae bacterium]
MKKNLGATNALYPMPIVVVGTEVNGKANYNAIAHVGIIDHKTLSISMGKIHYSNQGIKEHKTLSINITAEDMVEEMDHVGKVSGAKEDKSQIFNSVYGELKGAPMIENAPVSMECEVIDIYDQPEFDVFIVKVVNTYADEAVLTDGKIDFAKVKPVLFDMPKFGYWKLGPRAERK